MPSTTTRSEYAPSGMARVSHTICSGLVKYSITSHGCEDIHRRFAPRALPSHVSIGRQTEQKPDGLL
jgi:hypothetical protein